MKGHPLEAAATDRERSEEARSALLSSAPRGSRGGFLGGLGPRGRRRFRLATLGSSLLLALCTVGLAAHSLRLESRLEGERQRMEALEQQLRRSADSSLSVDAFRVARAEIREGLSVALDRLESVEERLDSGRRVIAEASRSVLFLQGSYGYVDRASGKLLRHLTFGSGEDLVLDAAGQPMLTVESDGQLIETPFTGTGFVAGPGGLLVTNRHVARPWEVDEELESMRARGFEPTLIRFIGYLSGERRSFEIEVRAVGRTADLAVLRAKGLPASARPLPLGSSRPQPGDEVLLLGYPAGVRALLARAEEGFVEQLLASGAPDGWSLAKRLAERGAIAPLATRGIVGQVSRESIVYDAGTTTGGSGGPVIDHRGRVVAVNAAIMPEFAGSNLGIPAEKARRLLAGLGPGAREVEESTSSPGPAPGIPAGEFGADFEPASLCAPPAGCAHGPSR